MNQTVRKVKGGGACAAAAAFRSIAVRRVRRGRRSPAGRTRPAGSAPPAPAQTSRLVAGAAPPYCETVSVDDSLPTMEDAHTVRTIEDLAAYILRIQQALAHGEEIENSTTERLLEALAGWLDSRTEAEPSWAFFARAISTALIYE